MRIYPFDFITRQDDRHRSNVAVVHKDGIDYFYPLYDNGRSLFFEDTGLPMLKVYLIVKWIMKCVRYLNGLANDKK